MDHRFKSREKVFNRSGGLKKDAVLTGVRASLDGNVLVITSCN
ncbi:MAG: hypothetical protein Q8P58_02250 [Candidatus Adlerbacteria bacterium]|nr:hypothetical protein [Candidatus Adlerbacteria bacterium]